MSAVTDMGLPDAYGVRAVRNGLLERRALLRREIDARLHAARTSAPAGPGDDAAVLTKQNDLDLKEAERDVREVEAIDAALTRIDNGTYGRCSRCGEPIGHGRLAANPHALHCLACAATAERADGGAP